MNKYNQINVLTQKTKFLSKRIVANLSKTNAAIEGISSKSLLERINQHFAFLLFYNIKEDQLNLDGQDQFVVDGWTLFPNTVIHCTLKKRLFFIASAVNRLLIIFLKILKGSNFPEKPFAKTACIIKFHGFESKFFPDKLDDLKQFCDSGNIETIKNHDLIFFENSTQTNKNHRNLYFANDAILELYIFSFRPLCQRIKILYRVALKFSELLVKTCFHAELLVIFKESLQSPIVDKLIKEKILKTYYISNSDIWNQEISFFNRDVENFNFDILFYSTNNKFFQIKGEDEPTPIPAYQNLAIKTSWVWNDDQANWIKNILPDIKVQIAGPILFFPDDKQLPSKKTDFDISILVFDVIPTNEKTIKMSWPAWGYNYYSGENCKNFLRSLECIKYFFSQNDINIELKIKRNRADSHEKTYFELIDHYVKDNIIKLMPPDTNIVRDIKKFHGVITIPYTSAALLASQESIPTCIYDPTGLLVLNYQYNEYVTFTNTEKDLLEWVKSLIDNHQSIPKLN